MVFETFRQILDGKVKLVEPTDKIAKGEIVIGTASKPFRALYSFLQKQDKMMEKNILQGTDFIIEGKFDKVEKLHREAARILLVYEILSKTYQAELTLSYVPPQGYVTERMIKGWQIVAITLEEAMEKRRAQLLDRTLPKRANPKKKLQQAERPVRQSHPHNPKRPSR